MTGGVRCPSCGFESSDAQKFCGECGRKLGNLAPIGYTPPHLAERLLAEQAALEKRASLDGERKTVTALFADIKGSMELIEDLDPEEARAIVDPALQLMMDAVHRYEGYVAQALGDGIFALFGAPIAHEDHPQRALHAALRMQEEIGKLAQTLRMEKGIDLQIRVGVNTGEVVVRSIRKDDLRTDYVPVGHSTSLAARMESLAAPGSTIVSAYTHKLTEGYFDFCARGPTRVKGVSEPLEVYQLVGVGPLRTKLEMAARRGLTRFVGRQSEMAQLNKVLALARSGKGQILGVVGEPGVGKSRLFHEFKLAARSDCLTLEGFAVSHGKADPFLPLIEILKGSFGIVPEDDERQRREKIASKVTTLDRALEGILPYLFALFGILEAESPLHQMAPPIRRARTLDALRRLILAETKDQPLLLVLEDLHWMDDETGAFLSALGEILGSARILLLVNYRPEYQEPWGHKTYFSEIRLDPLEEHSAGEMLTALVGDEPELRPLKRMILQKSEGTPFFMEEIVRALFERGTLVRNGKVKLTQSLGEIRIPPTVDAMIATRVDRLVPEEKELLQAAAVIGREFPLAVLARVSGESEEKLRPLLSKLQTAEFVYEQALSAEPQYVFKHALTRDVAASSLLNERRATFHERAAQAIEELFANQLEERYGELAHHYRHSRNVDKAVDYSQLAGERAVRVSANVEAIGHLTSALQLLQILPDGPELAERELGLQISLGATLMATKGYGASEVGDAYARARQLCERTGETPRLFSVLWGSWAYHVVRGDIRAALDLGTQLLVLAERLGDPGLLVEAHYAAAQSFFFAGNLLSSRDHFDKGLGLYDPQAHRSLAFVYGQDPGVTCASFSTWGLWQLGYPDQALARIDEGLRLARAVNHPFSLDYALFMASGLHQLRREPELAARRAGEAIADAAERGFPFFSGWGSVIRGWAVAQQGRHAEGIAQIVDGYGIVRAGGSEMGSPLILLQLADAHRQAGRRDDALHALAEALAIGTKNGEYAYEAEIHRLKGDLLGSPDVQNQAEAEACFRRAIDIARRQQAKSWELRASTSLAHLLRHQGREEEAREMLGEIYGWFTEGFDTPDLREARALLGELRRLATRE